MKNFQQTPKQRRVRMASAKAALAQSRAPGQGYAGSWAPKTRVSGEPVERLAVWQPFDMHGWMTWGRRWEQ